MANCAIRRSEAVDEQASRNQHDQKKHVFEQAPSDAHQASFRACWHCGSLYQRLILAGKSGGQKEWNLVITYVATASFGRITSGATSSLKHGPQLARKPDFYVLLLQSTQV